MKTINTLFDENFNVDISNLSPVSLVANDDPSKVPSLKEVRPSFKNETPFTIYGCFGYMAVKLSLENKNFFLYSMSMHINAALQQLSTTLGDLKGRKIKFNTNEHCEIFTMSTTHAGYDYSITVE